MLIMLPKTVAFISLIRVNHTFYSINFAKNKFLNFAFFFGIIFATTSMAISRRMEMSTSELVFDMPN